MEFETRKVSDNLHIVRRAGDGTILAEITQQPDALWTTNLKRENLYIDEQACPAFIPQPSAEQAAQDVIQCINAEVISIVSDLRHH